MSIPQPLKCLIKNLDTGDEVTANFNPKEVAIEKAVPWNKHKTSKGDNPVLEFTDAEPKVFTAELLFDTYEQRANVYKEYIKKLESFTLIIDDKKKRPPMCIFLWGKGFPSFMGVIEAISTKFTMFLANGTPVRATVTIKMKQADKLTKAAERDDEGRERKGTAGPMADFSKKGKLATQEDARRADRFDANHREALNNIGSEDGTVPAGTPVPEGR